MNKSLGEVFRSAWNTVKHNFKALFLGILIYGVPTAVLSIVSSAVQDPRATVVIAPFSLLLILYMIFVSPLYMGYLTSVLRTYHLTGQPSGINTAWAAAKANYGRYMLTMLATIVISIAAVFIIMVVYMVVAMGGLMANASYLFSDGTLGDLLAIILPAIIVLLVLMSLFLFSLSFVQFIPGMEFPSAFKAVFASFRYVYRGNFWKTLGHVLLITLITSAIQAAITLPFYLPYVSTLIEASYMMDSYSLINFMSMQMSWMPLVTLIGTVVGWLVQVFVTPYMFEVYLNAKAVCDGKDSQKVQTTNQQPPYNGYGQYTPPQIPPDGRH